MVHPESPQLLLELLLEVGQAAPELTGKAR
jgi:hypothetical protein